MESRLAFEPPTLRCASLPAFRAGDWEATRRAFMGAATCKLRQAWNEHVDPEFQPAWASVGIKGNGVLWIYAKLQDIHISNAATSRNQRTWELGDVFEIFLEPHFGRSYFEFHVTPENQVLECEFAIPRRRDAPLPTLDESLIQSWTNVSQGQWEVLVFVPLLQLGEPHSGQWKFSFCRYDATPGRKPVLSSSSPHTMLDFHRREEWGELILPH